MKIPTYSALGFMALLFLPSFVSAQGGGQRWHVQIDVRERNHLASNDFSQVDLADLNQDGVPEMLFADPFFSTFLGPNDRGRVMVVDGATGHVIFDEEGIQSLRYFGMYAHFLDDISGDGIPDLAISDGQIGVYRLYLYSGADFQPLNDPDTDTKWHDVISIGDQTGDGLSELAAVRSYSTTVTLDILNGSDFSLIASKDLGSFPGLTRLGDLNGDGFDEVGMSYILRPVGLDHSEILSGTDLLPIPAFAGLLHEVRALGNAGDVDGDGIEDILAANFQESFPMRRFAGQVSVHSGANGTLLARHVGLSGDQIGFSVEGLGDVDQDGHADYLIGSKISQLRNAVRSNYLELRFFSGFDHSQQGVIRGFGPVDQGLKTLTTLPATPGSPPYIAVTDPVTHASGAMTSRVMLFRYGN